MSGGVGLEEVEVLMHRSVHHQASVDQMGWHTYHGGASPADCAEQTDSRRIRRIHAPLRCVNYYIVALTR
jgi:hypothetical protein